MSSPEEVAAHVSLRTGLSLAFAYVLLLAILALGLPLALGVDDRVGTEVRSQARSRPTWWRPPPPTCWATATRSTAWRAPRASRCAGA